MTKKPSQSFRDLEAVRADIDAIDQRLHALLIERMDYVHEVAKSNLKGRENKQAFRPGREAILLRKRVKMGRVDGVVLTHLWRQIMAAALKLEQTTPLGLLESPQQGRALASAHLWGGANTVIEIYTKAEDLFSSMRDHPAMIGFVRMDEKTRWWQSIADNIYIVARWPYLKSDTALPLYVLAHMLPEPSGDDYGVFVRDDRLIHKKGFVSPDQVASDEQWLGCFAREIDS